MNKVFLILAFCFCSMEVSCSARANAMGVLSAEDQAVMKQKMQTVTKPAKIQIAAKNVISKKSFKSKKSFLPKAGYITKRTCLNIMKVGLLIFSCINLIISGKCLRILLESSEKLHSDLFYRTYNYANKCWC